MNAGNPNGNGAVHAPQYESGRANSQYLGNHGLPVTKEQRREAVVFAGSNTWTGSAAEGQASNWPKESYYGTQSQTVRSFEHTQVRMGYAGASPVAFSHSSGYPTHAYPTSDAPMHYTHASQPMISAQNGVGGQDVKLHGSHHHYGQNSGAVYSQESSGFVFASAGTPNTVRLHNKMDNSWPLCLEEYVHWELRILSVHKV